MHPAAGDDKCAVIDMPVSHAVDPVSSSSNFRESRSRCRAARVVETPLTNAVNEESSIVQKEEVQIALRKNVSIVAV